MQPYLGLTQVPLPVCPPACAPHAASGHPPWCVHTGEARHGGEGVGSPGKAALKEQPRQRKEARLPWGCDKTAWTQAEFVNRTGELLKEACWSPDLTPKGSLGFSKVLLSQAGGHQEVNTFKGQGQRGHAW